MIHAPLGWSLVLSHPLGRRTEYVPDGTAVWKPERNRHVTAVETVAEAGPPTYLPHDAVRQGNPNIPRGVQDFLDGPHAGNRHIVHPATYLPTTHPNMVTTYPNMVGTYLPTTHPYLVGDGVSHQVMLIDHG